MRRPPNAMSISSLPRLPLATCSPRGVWLPLAALAAAWLVNLWHPATAAAAEPLRVLVRAGEPFREGWSALLRDRGAAVTAVEGAPTPAQLEAADVLVLHGAPAAALGGADRAAVETFLSRGRGLVVLHEAIQAPDPAWWQSIVGAAWSPDRAQVFTGDIPLYFTDYAHPIIEGVSNWDFEDRIAWGLDLAPAAQVLASSYAPDKRHTKAGRMLPSVYDIVPQIWTLERRLPEAGAAYRAFVSLPGQATNALRHAPLRTVWLRAIAWAARRDVDQLCSPADLASLRYHAGGPTAPAQAAQALTAHPDFTVRLVAAEPLVQKPISLDWDPSGRLWVAETPEYPYRRSTSGPTRDRISILTDTNQDGTMDARQVFHEGLHLVTSLALHRDGVIVAQAPDILWIRDTDGDGRSDKTVRLFTGFGTNDTHAVLSNLRRGPDGWIYATVGYSRGDIHSGDRQRHFGRILDGVFRFRPDGSALEQVSSKASNTWGVDVSPDGEIFFSQANGNHINHVVLPESALSRGRVTGTTSYRTIEDHKRAFPLREPGQQAYAQIDFVGGFTAASGACLYEGGAWPEPYSRAYFVAEPTLNIVHLDLLRPDGPSFAASRDPGQADREFLAATDLWFRPIHLRTGPDGALYVLDFYNQAAVHNDTRGPRHDPHSNAAIRPDRDRYFGRIWRVQHRAARALPKARLAGASTADLAAALAHPNGWTRSTAARLLVEKQDPATPAALQSLVQSLHFRGLDEAKAQALWVLHQLGQLDPSLTAQAIATDGKPTVQKAALRIAAERAAAAPASAPSNAGTETGPVTAAVLERLRSSQPRVRLEALVTLAGLPVSSEVRSNVVEVYADLGDPWLESAAIGVASRDPIGFIAAATRSSRPAQLTNLVHQLSRQAAEETARSRTPSSSRLPELLVLLASAPEAADPLKRAALEGMGRGSDRAGNGRPPALAPETAEAFRTLLAGPTVMAVATLPVAVRWDGTGALRSDILRVSGSLLEKMRDESRSDAARGQMVSSLLTARQFDTNVLPAVARLLGPGESTALRRSVVEALAGLGDAAATRSLVSALPRFPTDLFEHTIAQLLRRPDAALALLAALEAGAVAPSTLSPPLAHRLRTHADPEVSRRATALYAKLRGPADREKETLLARLAPEVSKPGDAKAGREIFTKNCALCHRFNGEGKDTAPDLTGMGAHGPAELLVHTLDPNRVVEPNYVAVNLETRDGESHTGVVVRENKTTVVIRDASGETEIKAADIVSRTSTGRSLMPEGFESLGAPALRDLLAYLCAAEAKYRLIPLGSVVTADSTRGLFDSLDREDQSLPFKRFGLVKAGEVPFEILNPAHTASNLNLVVLRGGKGHARGYPRRVELTNLALPATRLHFLGGIGAWAWPWGGEERNRGLLVGRITVTHADGQQERFDLTNGVTFVDFANVEAEVSGSRRVPGLLQQGQLRTFSRTLANRSPVDRILLESFDTTVIPVFVALTAENAPTAGDPTQAPATQNQNTRENSPPSPNRREARRNRNTPGNP
ncbi:MAG: hypothetical protein RJA22_225 [Verrucomicrobiota bacterium]